MKNKTHLSLALAMVFSVSLYAEFNPDILNAKIKEDGSQLKVVNVVKAWGGANLVTLGDEEKKEFLNVLVSDQNDIGFVVSGSFSMNEDGKKKESEINSAIESVMPQPQLPDAELVASIHPKVSMIDDKAILYFNGAKKDKNGTLVVVADPRCPHCVKDLGGKLHSEFTKGTPLMIIFVGMLGEESLSDVSKVISHKEAIGGNYETMLRVLKGDVKVEATQAHRDIANKASESILNIKEIAEVGVPYKYMVK